MAAAAVDALSFSVSVLWFLKFPPIYSVRRATRRTYVLRDFFHKRKLRRLGAKSHFSKTKKCSRAHPHFEGLFSLHTTFMHARVVPLLSYFFDSRQPLCYEFLSSMLPSGTPTSVLDKFYCRTYRQY
jgi:hypothetical protein